MLSTGPCNGQLRGAATVTEYGEAKVSKNGIVIVKHYSLITLFFQLQGIKIV